MERNPDPGAILDGWSRIPKLLDGGARSGAWKLGSGCAEVVCEASELYK